MSPPYTTASSPIMESNLSEDASEGVFTQLYRTMVSSWQTAWAFLKPIYTWAVILLASYEIYSLYDVHTASKRAAKAVDNFQQHCSDFSRSQKAMVGLMDGLREVAHSMTADNKATVEAIERAMAAGPEAAPPEVAQLLKKLGETQTVASDCMLSVGLRILEVAQSLNEDSGRVLDEYQLANNLLSEVVLRGLRLRRK